MKTELNAPQYVFYYQVMTMRLGQKLGIKNKEKFKSMILCE